MSIIDEIENEIEKKEIESKQVYRYQFGSVFSISQPKISLSKGIKSMLYAVFTDPKKNVKNVA
jgi:hypothetical protein